MDSVERTSDKPRVSNFEILRILSAFLIIMHHAIRHGVISNIQYSEAIPTNLIVADLLQAGGRVSVAIFVTLTGYFDLTNKFSFRQILKVFAIVLPISLGIFFFRTLFTSFTINENHPFETILSFFQYRFVTSYIVLMLIKPFFNFKLLTKKSVIIMLVGSISLVHMATAVVNISLFNGIEILQFICFYVIGLAIKQGNVFNQKFWSSKIVLMFTLFLVLVSSIVMPVLYNNNLISKAFFTTNHYLLNDDISFPTLLFVISLFHFVAKTKPFSSKIINLIGSAAFGVFLLHDNRNIRQYLWIDIFHTNDFVFVPALDLVLYITVISIIIFFICTIISLSFHFTIEKWLMFIYDKKINGK